MTDAESYDVGEFTPKIISILIAIVIFAVVLVPITNVLLAGDDSGESGGQSEDYIVVNTLQDRYNEIGITCNYKTYQIFATEHANNIYGKLIPAGYSMTIDMDTLNEYKSNFVVPTDYEYNGTTYMFDILCWDEEDYSVNLQIKVYHNPDSPSGFAFESYFDEMMHYADLDSVTSFTATITDMSISWTYTVTWEGESTPSTYSEEVGLTDNIAYSIQYISNEDIGWVNSNIYGYYDDNDYASYSVVTKGSVFCTDLDFTLSVDGDDDVWCTLKILIQVGDIIDNTIRGTAVCPNVQFWPPGASDSGYFGTFTFEYEVELIPISDGKYELSRGDITTDSWVLTSVTDVYDFNDGNPIDVEVEVDYSQCYLNYARYYLNRGWSYYSSADTNPITYTNEGAGGNGGNGGNGITGTTATLISLIPVLVGVGLLVYILGQLGIIDSNRLRVE